MLRPSVKEYNVAHFAYLYNSYCVQTSDDEHTLTAWPFVFLFLGSGVVLTMDGGVVWSSSSEESSAPST